MNEEVYETKGFTIIYNRWDLEMISSDASVQNA